MCYYRPHLNKFNTSVVVVTATTAAAAAATAVIITASLFPPVVKTASASPTATAAASAAAATVPAVLPAFGHVNPHGSVLHQGPVKLQGVLQQQIQHENISVTYPGCGAFLTPGSGIRDGNSPVIIKSRQ
jgi:hypothetical protein